MIVTGFITRTTPEPFPGRGLIVICYSSVISGHIPLKVTNRADLIDFINYVKRR